MTERHVVANGDLPPDGVLVLAYWDEPKWFEYDRWGVVRHFGYNGTDDFWEICVNDSWDLAYEPTYWWALPEVAP